jgi:glycine cleavage system H protein
MVALFVLAVFIFFILLDIAVLKFQGKTHPAFEKILYLSNLSFLPELEIKVPGNIVFSKGHVWMKKNKSGLIKLGVDEFVNKSLGKISIQNNLYAGKELKKGDILFEGIIGEAKLKFRSPVNGIVKSVNPISYISEISDSYSNWNLEISSADFSAGSVNYFSGSNALNWLKEEFLKLDNFLMNNSIKPELVGITMYDGGKVVDGASAILIKGAAEDFEKEFLTI